MNATSKNTRREINYTLLRLIGMCFFPVFFFCAGAHLGRNDALFIAREGDLFVIIRLVFVSYIFFWGFVLAVWCGYAGGAGQNSTHAGGCDEEVFYVVVAHVFAVGGLFTQSGGFAKWH